MERKLTINIRPDWATAVREASVAAAKGMKRGTYQGETLNFETPGAFFSRLTSNRWAMLAELQGAGNVGVRDDATALVELGLIERSETGALSCPYVDSDVISDYLTKMSQALKYGQFYAHAVQPRQGLNGFFYIRNNICAPACKSLSRVVLRKAERWQQKESIVVVAGRTLERPQRQ